MKPIHQKPSLRIPAELRSLAKRLVQAQARANELDLFTDDRELLCCPFCGLMEDVDANGRLFTCHKNGDSRDTGLRFVNLRGTRFRCPACENTFLQSTVEEMESHLAELTAPKKITKRGRK